MEASVLRATWPLKVVDGDHGPRSLEKLFDIVPPRHGVDNVQSVCRYGATWLVFHHGSVMQVYGDDGRLEREVRVEGGLIHPNDCAVLGEEVIVCDAGEPTPVLKRVDPLRGSVEEVYPTEVPGWRLASVACDPDGGIVTVAAEDIPLEERSRVLVSRHESAGADAGHRFTVPSAHTYSQGCTIMGSFLYLNANDGITSDEARVTAIDLRSGAVVDSLHIEHFGETEGLDGVWLGREPCLVTALRRAVYLVATP